MKQNKIIEFNNFRNANVAPKDDKKLKIKEKIQKPPKPKKEKLKIARVKDGKRNYKIIAVFIVLLLFCAGAFLLFAPFFNVVSITTNQTDEKKSEQIIGASGIALGTNIFKANLGKIKKNVESIIDVKSVNIKRVFPNCIDIQVELRKPQYLIRWGDCYIGFDEDGIAVQIFKELEAGSFEVVFEEISDFSENDLGKKMRFSNSNSLDLLNLITEKLTQTDLYDKVRKIDISDVERLRIFLEVSQEKIVEVIVGKQTDDLYVKFQKIKSIISNISKSGTLDITGKKEIFREDI